MSAASLVEHNVALLEEGAALLASLDDEAYTRSVPWLRNASVGAHVRHCLDFYACLLDGIDRGLIDHGRRGRDGRVEGRREAAVEAVRGVVGRLRAANTGGAVAVRLDHDPSVVVESTVARELEAAASHTIHHYAVISVLLRVQGRDVPDHFGVAPSTLRFRASS